MPITTERLPRSLVALTIEVEDDRLEASMGKAVRRVSQQVKIPGFRPGKAPRDVVERAVGRPALIQEALDQLLPDLYNEAIESEEIEAIGQPDFELQSMEPLVVHATVPVRPSVELNEYRSLRAPRPEAEVSPEQVEETLTELQRRFATLEPADRPVDWGDTVRADVTVSVEGQGEPHVEEDAEFRVTRDAVVSLPGFLDHLIGLERGGPHEISFSLPEDFAAADMAGKTASYRVQIHEVKQEVLPDLDDDFVKSLDEDGMETVEALRERVTSDVQEQAEAAALARYQDEVIDLLLANAELDYPEVLVERETDRLLDQQSNHASHTPEELEQWLQRIGKTEQEVRDDLRAAADLNVRRALLLGELVEREQIEVPEERVDEEVDALVEQLAVSVEDAEQRESFRSLFSSEETRASIRERLLTQAAVERLVEICSEGEAAPAERARGTRRRRSRRAESAEGAETAQAGAAPEDEDEQSAASAAGEQSE